MSLDTEPEIKRQRSFSNFESSSQLASSSWDQLQPHGMASAMPPFFNQTRPNASMFDQIQRLHDQRVAVASTSTSISTFQSKPAPSPSLIATSYPSFDTPHPNFPEEQQPPLPPKLPRHLTPRPERQFDRPPTKIDNRTTKYFDFGLSELPGDAEWCPTPDIAFQLPYMPASTPAPNARSIEDSTCSEEKIAITYTPFSYEAGSYTDLLPNSQYLPTQLSNKSTESSAKDLIWPIAINDDEKQSIMYSSYNPAPGTSRVNQDEQKSFTYPTYSPVPTISPSNQFEEQNKAYSSYAPTPTMSPSNQFQGENNTYSSDVPTSPVSFSHHQSMSSLSFVEAPDENRYPRFTTRGGLTDSVPTGDEDPGETFFRELRMQEIEKRKRLAVSKRSNHRT